MSLDLKADIKVIKLKCNSFSYKKDDLKTDRFDPENYKNLDTFHRAIYPMLLVTQFFALMPLTGISNPDPHKTKFKLISINMILTIGFLFSAAINVILYSYKLNQVGINTKNIVGLVFFTNCLVACILFVKLASKWPNIVAYWTKIEVQILAKYCRNQRGSELKRKICFIGALIFSLAICEHSLFYASELYVYLMDAKYCNASAGDFDGFMYKRFRHVCEVMGYSKTFALYQVITNICFTYIWNYMDVFIMIISIGITVRFRQFNTSLRSIIESNALGDRLEDYRKDYIRLIKLLEYIDEEISYIVLLSCSNNLYFICVQLLNIFTKLKWLINYIYFWYSLIYLIVRTVIIYLCAAAINDEAMIAVKILRNISSVKWNNQVERFLIDIMSTKPALSGKKFFFITRKLLFNLAGTIITYELVLLQFDTDNKKKSLPLCD